MKIPFKDRSQMTMKEKIANPLSVKEALELSKGSIIPIPIGDYSEVVPSCGGSDAIYFAGMILEPIEKFYATHFPDGREKNKAVTMW